MAKNHAKKMRESISPTFFQVDMLILGSSSEILRGKRFRGRRNIFADFDLDRSLIPNLICHLIRHRPERQVV